MKWFLFTDIHANKFCLGKVQLISFLYYRRIQFCIYFKFISVFFSAYKYAILWMLLYVSCNILLILSLISELNKLICHELILYLHESHDFMILILKKYILLTNPLFITTFKVWLHLQYGMPSLALSTWHYRFFTFQRRI